MSGLEFTKMLNDITIVYALLLILIVLMYIAFYRKPASPKEPQLTTK